MLEAQVINDFNAGTDAGFTAVFNYFFIPLCFFANRIIKDNDQAKDIVIIALTITFERHAMFTEFKKLQGYLYISVANRCRNEIRTRARSKTTGDLDEQMPSDDIVTNNIISIEFMREIKQQLSKLAPLRRRVIELFYIEGKSNEDICNILNLHRHTVYVHKFRGIEQIKGILKLKKAYP